MLLTRVFQRAATAATFGAVPARRALSMAAMQGRSARPVMAMLEKARKAVGLMEQARGMKVRSSVKKLCEGCKVSAGVFFGWFCWGGGRRRGREGKREERGEERRWANS